MNEWTVEHVKYIDKDIHVRVSPYRGIGNYKWQWQCWKGSHCRGSGVAKALKGAQQEAVKAANELLKGKNKKTSVKNAE